MNVFKITHTRYTESKWETHYSIVPAESKSEAIRQIKPELIIAVEDMGEQKEDIYGEWWDIWNQKKLDEAKKNRKEINAMKSPSHKKL